VCVQIVDPSSYPFPRKEEEEDERTRERERENLKSLLFVSLGRDCLVLLVFLICASEEDELIDRLCVVQTIQLDSLFYSLDLG
jgi:hypothetical protein